MSCRCSSADVLARAAEDDGALVVGEAQHVDQRRQPLAVGAQVRDVADVLVRARRPRRRADRWPRRPSETCLRQRANRRRQRRREEQRAPLGRRRLEQRLERLAKAEVEHLVGLVEHDAPRCADRSSVLRSTRSTSRPGVPTTTSTPWRSARASPRRSVPPVNETMRAPVRREQPAELALHLRRQLARRRDDQRARLGRRAPASPRRRAARAPMTSPKATVLPEPVCDETSRSRVGRLEHACLHRGGRLIVALAQRLGEGRRRAERGEVESFSHGG